MRNYLYTYIPNLIQIGIGILIGLFTPSVVAQSSLTIDQVEAQVTALQALTSPSPSGQSNNTLADQVIALQGQQEALQNCCNKMTAPTMLQLPLQVSEIQDQMATVNLQLSTVGTLTQLGLDNQTNIQALQAQVNALEQKVNAIVPVTPAPSP